MRRLIAALTALLAATAAAFGQPAPVPSSKPAPGATRSAAPSPKPTRSPLPVPAGILELSGDQIMINAEKATRLHAPPSYITYQMHEVFVHHGQRQEYDYRVWYRYDGKGLMQNISKDHFGRAETYFGYPFPSSPDNNILLYATPDPVQTPPPPVGTPVPLASGATAPPVIYIQPVVGDRYYSVTLVGIEDYNGKPVYHVGLRPLRDERGHPWKDLWIDTKSFEVWKAHAHASGSKGPAVGTIDATVEFAPVGNYWLVSKATGDGEVHFAVSILGDSGHYEYTFHDFGFPASIPEWYFDPKLFKGRH